MQQFKADVCVWGGDVCVCGGGGILDILGRGGFPHMWAEGDNPPPFPVGRDLQGVHTESFKNLYRGYVYKIAKRVVK